MIVLLDAMAAIHQDHMQTMSAEMKSKMQAMMGQMDMRHSEAKNQVSALEADVLTDMPNSKQVAVHTSSVRLLAPQLSFCLYEQSVRSAFAVSAKKPIAHFFP